MSLDQQLADGADAVAVFVDPEQWHDELRADLFAAARRAAPAGDSDGDGTFDPYAYQTRPTVLRRLAGLLAGELPEHLDRLVAADASAVPLTTAVALHTGLPFAIAGRPGTDPLYGDVHRGELAAVVAAVTAGGHSALNAAELVRARGAHVAAVLTVIDRNAGAEARLREAGHPLRTLFPADGTGG